MPRPVKCRKVCHFPNVLEFLPADNAEKKVPIVLTVDEYETIRLLDKKGYSQEQCAVSMPVSYTHLPCIVRPAELTSAADKISNPRSAFASLRQGGYTPLRR